MDTSHHWWNWGRPSNPRSNDTGNREPSIGSDNVPNTDSSIGLGQVVTVAEKERGSTGGRTEDASNESVINLSDLSELVHGQLTPQQFIAKAAVDLKKDLGVFGQPEFLDWAIDAIGAFIEATGKVSPTIVTLIENGLKKELGLDTGPAQPVEQGAS